MKKKSINLIACILLLLCFTILSIISCTVEDENVKYDVEYIKYGTSFGECIGYCINDLTITSSEVTLEKSGWTIGASLPRITDKQELENTYLQELFDEVNFDNFLNLDEVIGCPDCADGGEEWIEIKANNQTHKVTFEYLVDETPELQDIVTSLRDLHNSLKKDAYVILDNDVYNTTTTDNYTITAISIENDILNLSVSSTGCSGSTWLLNVIDSEDILESNPFQRKLKVHLINEEACLAEIPKTYPIDISKLQVEGESELQLTIEGWNETITYNY